MAAHVLRLRVALLLGALRGEPAYIARVIVGLLLLVVATVLACEALLSLSDASTPALQTVSVLCGSAVTLGFALGPIFTGAADPLDPRRFVVLGLSPLRLAAILWVAGLISLSAVVLITVGVCLVIAWSALGVPWIVGTVSVVLGVATCVLLARVGMALTALFLRERRSRELTGLFVVAMLVVVVPAGVFLASLEWRRGAVPRQLLDAVSVLSSTPIGAAWAIPGGVAREDGSAGISALVAIGTLGVLALVWAWLVRRILTTTERPTPVRERTGLGWFAVAPGTTTGGIAARSLLYWLRDRRYLLNVIVIPVAAVLTVVPPLVAGVSLADAALLPVPLAALFLGWVAHNDLAYDSTAVWMHIASGVRGAPDRIGRLVPIFLIAVPVLAVAIPVAVSIHGRWSLLPAMVGVCGSLFLCGLGLSSISSVIAPYAVTRPGDSPFQQPQRVGAAGAWAQAIVLFGAVVLSAPALWWAWLSLTGIPDAGTSALWTGLAIGVAVLAIGVAVGAGIFERRGGRLMEFAEST